MSVNTLGSVSDSDHDKGLNVPYKAKSPKTAEERQAELALALEKDPGVGKWSLRACRMYLITLIICCCAGDSGFDGTVMAGVNAMTQYQRYFNLNGEDSKTSLVFGIFTIGSLCGTFPAAYLPDRFGRRACMFIGNSILIIGAIVTATASKSGPFLGGRFLTGFGTACAGPAAKSYLAELAPPKNRGAYLGFLNSFYYVGQMAASGMMVSTGKFKSNWSWRLPLYIQVAPAAINVLFVFFCPESPRWLYSTGKKDQARKILATYHSSNGDIYSPLVEIQINEIAEKIEVDGADKRWWDFRPLFRTRADRYRSYMAILIGTFSMLTGNGLITYFLPVLLKNAGIVDQNKKLVLNFVNSVTSYVGALCGSFTVDYFGRRRNMLYATGALACILAIVAALSSHEGNAARSNAGIVFIFLFMVVYSFGWTPLQAIYASECLGYSARTKGLAMLGIVAQASACITTFGMPPALAKLKWKVYMIYAIWDCFEVVVIYFTVVETKGLTLEELEEIFQAPKPVAFSLELQKQRKITRRRIGAASATA